MKHLMLLIMFGLAGGIYERPQSTPYNQIPLELMVITQLPDSTFYCDTTLVFITDKDTLSVGVIIYREGDKPPDVDGWRNHRQLWWCQRKKGEK